MLKILSKIFNISCLLGLHEKIPVAMTTKYKAEDDLRKILHETYQWDAKAINILPLPKNNILTVTSCPHCGYIENNIIKYLKNRTQYYIRVIGKHVKAVDAYMVYYEKCKENPSEIEP